MNEHEPQDVEPSNQELNTLEASQKNTKSRAMRDITIAFTSAILGAVVAAVISPYYASKHSEEKVIDETEILGNWDDKKARSIVMEKLKAYDWSQHEDTCIGDECDPPHNLFKNTYNFSDSSRDWKIIVADTNGGGGGAHAQQAYLSIFEFIHTDIGWDLATQDIALTSAGSWGNVDEDMTSFGWIAPNKRALFLNDSYTTHGITHSGLTLFAKIGSTYEKLLYLETGCDDLGVSDEGGTSLETAYSFMPSQAGFFDLAIETEGTVNNKPFKFEQTYEFNGHSYFPGSDDESSYLNTSAPPDCNSLDKKFGSPRLPQQQIFMG